MKKRELTKTIIYEPAKTRILNNQCPSCGLSKEKWTRRKDWRCCSVECTNKFQDMYITYGWADIRTKVLKRDNYTCVKCGDNRREVVVTIKYRRITNWEHIVQKPEKIPIKLEYKNAERKETLNNLIGDHIIPIALGGDEFDINNVQTLCLKCNKEKTAKDIKKIAVQRKKEKLIKI